MQILANAPAFGFADFGDDFFDPLALSKFDHAPMFGDVPQDHHLTGRLSSVGRNVGDAANNWNLAASPVNQTRLSVPSLVDGERLSRHRVDPHQQTRHRL